MTAPRAPVNRTAGWEGTRFWRGFAACLLIAAGAGWLVHVGGWTLHNWRNPYWDKGRALFVVKSGQIWKEYYDGEVSSKPPSETELSLAALAGASLIALGGLVLAHRFSLRTLMAAVLLVGAVAAVPHACPVERKARQLVAVEAAVDEAGLARLRQRFTPEGLRDSLPRAFHEQLRAPFGPVFREVEITRVQAPSNKQLGFRETGSCIWLAFTCRLDAELGEEEGKDLASFFADVTADAALGEFAPGEERDATSGTLGHEMWKLRRLREKTRAEWARRAETLRRGEYLEVQLRAFRLQTIREVMAAELDPAELPEELGRLCRVSAIPAGLDKWQRGEYLRDLLRSE
jgi:hypothetical protein